MNPCGGSSDALHVRDDERDWTTTREWRTVDGVQGSIEASPHTSQQAIHL